MIEQQTGGLDWFNLSARHRRWLMVVLVISLIAGLVVCLLPSEYIETGVEVSDKALHAGAFFAYALLFHAASYRSFWRFQVPVLLAYGALTEILQALTGWRTFSLLDFAADAAGVLLYWVLFRVGSRWLQHGATLPRAG